MKEFSASDYSVSAASSNRATDWLISIGLTALVIATRWPFRTSMLYNWDSANFALGIRHFDVRVHAPHPPGYFSYVAVGNLINSFVGDANASLVSLSIALSAGAVLVTYFLGKAMFNRPAGLVASLLLAFSVTFWTYGEVALAYVSLAFFSSLAALFAWQVVSRRNPSYGYALHLSIVYALGSGFRPDLLLFLAPLWIWSIWLQGWKARLYCAVVTAAGFLLWYVATALLSGGFDQYHAVLAAYIQTDVAARYSSTHKGLSGLLVNVRDTASYVFYALYASSLLLALAGLWFAFRRQLWISRVTVFFLVWVTPMVLFYTVVHIGDPGYVFTFLPAIMVLLGAFICRVGTLDTWDIGKFTVPQRFAEMLGRPHPNPLPLGEGTGANSLLQLAPCFPLVSRYHWKRPAAATLVAIVIAANIGIFLLHPRPMTAQGIRQNDLDYREKVAFIESQVDPRSTILLTYDSYKHLLYYLPDYRQSIWVDVFADTGGEVRIPAGVKAVLLVDARLNAINRSPGATREIQLPSGGKMYSIAAVEGQVLTVGGRAIAVRDLQ